MFTPQVIWDRHVERLHRLYLKLHERQSTLERRFFAGELSDQAYLDAAARQQQRILRVVTEYKRYCRLNGLLKPPMLGRRL